VILEGFCGDVVVGDEGGSVEAAASSLTPLPLAPYPPVDINVAGAESCAGRGSHSTLLYSDL